MRDLFLDENAKLSSTRVVLISTLGLFLLTTVTDLYCDCNLHDGIYEIMKISLGAGLTSTAARSTIKNWNKE